MSWLHSIKTCHTVTLMWTGIYKDFIIQFMTALTIVIDIKKNCKNNAVIINTPGLRFIIVLKYEVLCYTSKCFLTLDGRGMTRWHRSTRNYCLLTHY